MYYTVGGPLGSVADIIPVTGSSAMRTYCVEISHTSQAGSSVPFASTENVVLKRKISSAVPAVCCLSAKKCEWVMLCPSMIWLCTKAELNMKYAAI